MTQIQGIKYLIWLSVDLFQPFLGMVSEAPVIYIFLKNAYIIYIFNTWWKAIPDFGTEITEHVQTLIWD